MVERTLIRIMEIGCRGEKARDRERKARWNEQFKKDCLFAGLKE